MIKKIFLLLIFILLINPVQAYENYVIITDSPYRKVSVSDLNIVKVNPVYTLSNIKNAIIVSPVAVGKAKLSIDFFGKIKTVDITVKKESTALKPQSGLEYYSIDNPPKGLELPKPPVYSDILPPPNCDIQRTED